jgi:mono/diheme cytochrome c family protein
MVARAMLFAGLETHQKVEIAAMAAVFIVFALVSSFVLPRRNANFPGSGLRWYLVVCVGLFVAMMSTIIFIAKEPSTAAASKENTAPPTKTTPSPPATTGDATAGKAVFASSGCGACHTFTPAGSKGTVGPDLDKLPESATTANRGSLADFTRESIVDPGAYVAPGYANGIMPTNFGTSLTKKQIDDLVAFLTQGH